MNDASLHCPGSFQDASATSFTLTLTHFGVPLEIDDDEEDTGATRYISLAELYVAADVLNARILRDDTIGAIIGLSLGIDVRPCLNAIEIIYTQTPASSKARQLLLDLYLSYTEPEWLQENRDVLPPDVIFDFAVGSWQGATSEIECCPDR